MTSPRYDIARFGAEAPRFSPRQADLLWVVGTISQRQAPVLKRIYEQMVEPKWVLAFGTCASCGGFYDNYTTRRRASTKSSRATSTSPAARRAPRRCSTASCSSRTRSRAATARPASSSRANDPGRDGSSRFARSSSQQGEAASMSKKVLDVLKAKFGAAILETHAQLGDDTAVVAPRRWREVAASSCATTRASPCNMFVDLCGVDYPATATPRFEVVCTCCSLDAGAPHPPQGARRRRATATAPRSTRWSPVWPGANWFERETFDLIGISFHGHPDLRRILMYPEFVGHPLRKDYPADKTQPLVPFREGLRSRSSRRSARDEGMRFGRQTSRAPQRPRRRADRWNRSITISTRASSSSRPSRCSLNMGPSHPAMHGTVRIVLELSGETIVKSRRADRLPAPRLREDVRARHLDAGLPVRRSPATTSRRCSTTSATRSRSRSCSASRCPSAASTTA